MDFGQAKASLEHKDTLGSRENAKLEEEAAKQVRDAGDASGRLATRALAAQATAAARRCRR